MRWGTRFCWQRGARRLLERRHDRGVEDGVRVQVAQLSKPGCVRTGRKGAEGATRRAGRAIGIVSLRCRGVCSTGRNGGGTEA